MIVAVSGGRDYADVERVNSVLDRVHANQEIHLLIEGACHVGHGGADELARKWAKRNQVNCLSVPAKAKLHGWPDAGPLRNQEIGFMLPDLWVLFPGKSGTASARRVAKSHGIKILEVDNGTQAHPDW